MESKKKNDINIVYRLGVTDDKPAVLEFLREHFFPYEPLHCSIEPKGQDAHLEEYFVNCVDTPNQLCLLALSGSQIIGVRLCIPKGPDEEQKLLKEASEIPGSQFAKVLLVLAKLEKDSNVFKKFKNCNRAMHGNGLVVHKDFRGHGIGLQLLDKSIQIAKVLGYPLFTNDCTSIYSARLSELLGMECVNVCKMEDYRAPGSDEQVIFPAENQKFIKTYAKLLD